jgi:hypothetical protein
MQQSSFAVALVLIALLIGLVAALIATMVIGGSARKRITAGGTTFLASAGFSLYVEQSLGLLRSS